MENQKKKWRWSDVSKNVLICLIPPAVAASIITPIAIVAKNKQSQDTITLTYNDCFENGAITNKVNIKKVLMLLTINQSIEMVGHLKDEKLLKTMKPHRSLTLQKRL